jgi:hypothetical protein
MSAEPILGGSRPAIAMDGNQSFAVFLQDGQANNLESRDVMDFSESDEFHDSNLLALDLDLVNCTLTCRLEAYLSSEASRHRVPISLKFRKVRAFSATLDLEQLQTHAKFGNIAHWSPRKGSNLISLAAGAISFEADGFEAAAE